MDGLTKMLIALISMMTMFLANIFIIFSRRKLKGILRVVVSFIAYFLLIISLIMIVVVVFSF